MQQLTLQFEGYAPIGQAKTQGTAKQCHRVKISELSIGWAIKQANASAAIQKVMSRVKLFSQAAAAVAFGFGLVFLSAIIGG